MTNRSTKWLLGFIALGLWACALRPWLGSTPVKAQATGGGIPPPVIYTPPSAPLLSVSANGVAYVVSGSFISAYTVEGNPRQLKKIGQINIPASPPPNFSEPRGF